MTIDATFWVAISFFIFLGVLFYFKAPQKVFGALNESINKIKKDIDEAEKLKDEAKNILSEYEAKLSKSKVEVDLMIKNAQKESETNIISYENVGYVSRFLKKLNNLWVDAPSHDNKNIVGYVAVRHMYDEAHVTSIAVRKSFRGIGMGELLLMSAVSNAMKKNYKTTTLEVRVSNRIAQSLYKKYGFNEVGIRKRYYSDNDEDAYIMTTDNLDSDSYTSNFRNLVDDFNKRALNISCSLLDSYSD